MQFRFFLGVHQQLVPCDLCRLPDPCQTGQVEFHFRNGVLFLFVQKCRQSFVQNLLEIFRQFRFFYGVGILYQLPQLLVNGLDKTAQPFLSLFRIEIGFACPLAAAAAVNMIRR